MSILDLTYEERAAAALWHRVPMHARTRDEARRIALRTGHWPADPRSLPTGPPADVAGFYREPTYRHDAEAEAA